MSGRPVIAATLLPLIVRTMSPYAHRAPIDELAAHREARHRLTRLARHRPVAFGGVEARHGADELEVVRKRHLAEVAAPAMRRN